MVGACGLAYEFTISHVSSQLLGSTPIQWAITIALMMFFMGIGASIQRYVPNSITLKQLVFVEWLIILLGSLSPLLLTWAYVNNTYMIMHFAVVSLIGILVGMEIPLLLLMNENLEKNLSSNTATVFKWEYFGALAGGLIWSFALLPYYSINQVAICLGAINIILCFLLIIFFKLPNKKLYIFANTTIAILLLVFFTFVDTTHSKILNKMFSLPIVYNQHSAHQSIILTNRNDRTQLFLDNHLQFDSNDEYRYHEALVHPVLSLHDNAKNLLILGGGDGIAVREARKHKNIKRIIICELDQKVIDLAQTHHLLTKTNNNSLLGKNVFDSEQTSFDEYYSDSKKSPYSVYINYGDAFKFLKKLQLSFDIIIADFPDPRSPSLSRLYSREFYRLIRHNLSDNGFFVTQSSSPFQVKKAFANIGLTLEKSGFSTLPYHVYVSTFGEWGFWLAAKNTALNQRQLKDRIYKISNVGVNTKYLNIQSLKSMFVFGKDKPLYKPTEKPTTLARPVSYFQYQEQINAF